MTEREELGRTGESKFGKEQRAFRHLLPQLLETHRGRYVAVHQEAVVDSDTDLIALALRVYGVWGISPFTWER